MNDNHDYRAHVKFSTEKGAQVELSISSSDKKWIEDEGSKFVRDATYQFMGTTRQIDTNASNQDTGSEIPMQPQLPSSSATPQFQQQAQRFQQTFAEWAMQYHLSSHHDKVLAVMEYEYSQNGKSDFTVSEISTMYEKARWSLAKNFADVLARGAKKQWFVESEHESETGNKLWRMTQTGYEHLQTLHKGGDE